MPPCITNFGNRALGRVLIKLARLSQLPESLLFPQKRTFADARAMSGKCQQRTCRFIVRFQFGCTPAASSASCQNVCCDRRNVPNSLGVPPTTVANASVIPDRIFGS